MIAICRNLLSNLGKRCVFRWTAIHQPIMKKWKCDTTKTTLLSTNNYGGYQSIGSFHSDNVELMVSLSDEVYSVPKLPFDYEPNFNTHSLHDNFPLSTDWAFVNHGAFGAALKCGNSLASKWKDYSETQPLRYFDRDLLPHLAYSIRMLADFCQGHRSAITLSRFNLFAFL